jgi:hypothetical protein
MTRADRLLRLASGWPLLVLLAARSAVADHGSPASAATGGSTAWLLGAAVLAVLLAVGWALFGPGARDPEVADPIPGRDPDQDDAGGDRPRDTRS